MRHLSRYPENTGVWQQTNIKDSRKKRGRIGIREFIRHLIVGLISRRGSKRVLERDNKRKVVEDQTMESVLKRIEPPKMSNHPSQHQGLQSPS